MAGARQVLRSPEQVALDLPLAGPMSRILAFSIDYSILLTVELLLFVAALFTFAGSIDLAASNVFEWLERLLEGDASEQLLEVLLLGAAVLVALQFLLESTYFIVCELTLQGRTPGKAMLGLRVMRDGALPIDLRASLLRNLLRMVDILPSSYLVGTATMLISREHKRVGDYAAGTVVVREDRPQAAPPLSTEPATAFRFDRDQLARVGADERRLIRQTLRRLEGLAQRDRERVVDRALEVIAQRIGLEDQPGPRERAGFLRALLQAAEEHAP